MGFFDDLFGKPDVRHYPKPKKDGYMAKRRLNKKKAYVQRDYYQIPTKRGHMRAPKKW